jgi:hypothetical protein
MAFNFMNMFQILDNTSTGKYSQLFIRLNITVALDNVVQLTISVGKQPCQLRQMGYSKSQ